MKETLCITRYCSIRDNKLTDAGRIFLNMKGAETADFLKEAYRTLAISYPKFYKMDVLCKLGFLCTEVLLKERDLNEEYGSDRTAIVLANSSSSLTTDRLFQESVSDRENYFPRPSVFVYTLPNLAAGEICIRHKFFGENIFFVSRYFDPDMLCSYVKDTLDNGYADCCIAGWLEADILTYDAFFCLIEKCKTINKGITIFESDTLKNLYSRKL